MGRAEGPGVDRERQDLLGCAVAPVDRQRVQILEPGVGEGPVDRHGPVLEHVDGARNDARQHRSDVLHRDDFAAGIRVRAVLVHQRDCDGPIPVVQIHMSDRIRPGEDFFRTAVAPRDTVLGHRVRARIGDRPQDQRVRSAFRHARRAGQRDRGRDIGDGHPERVARAATVAVSELHRQRVEAVVRVPMVQRQHAI